MANEIEALKSQAVQKEEEIAKDKGTVLQLKKIGQKFREQKDEAEKKVKELEEEDNETAKLLEESMERISTLETETEKLKADNEGLQKTSTLKEEQATTVLKTARAKIQKSEDEKKKLQLELEQIGE